MEFSQYTNYSLSFLETSVNIYIYMLVDIYIGGCGNSKYKRLFIEFYGIKI